MSILEDFLIVDGYNIINSWSELAALKQQNFEHAREKLVDILSDLQGVFKGKIIVVFDALNVKGGTEQRVLLGGIEIIYTQEGETADACIEKLVGRLPAGSIIGVATSDWAEQRIIFGRGAHRLSARDLYERVREAEIEREKYASVGSFEANKLDSNIEDHVKDTLEKLRRSK